MTDRVSVPFASRGTEHNGTTGRSRVTPTGARAGLWLIGILVFVGGGAIGYLVGVELSPGKAMRSAPAATRVTLPPVALYEEPAMPPEQPAIDYAPPVRLAAPDVPAPHVISLAPLPSPSLTDLDRPKPAWLRNAVAAPEPLGRPMIAVVFDDLGIDRRRSARAIELRGPLTMSFLAYADDLAGQAAAARANGHELMLHVPMQPSQDFVDPGPEVLRADLDEPELLRRLGWDLSRFDGFVGVNNHMGSRFTGDDRAMLVVLRELKRRGLLYLDSRTTAVSVAAVVAGDIGLPHVARDVFIDHSPTAESVRAQLDKLEQLATERGYAVGIAHPYDVTLEAVEDWLPSVRQRGFLLAPISAIARRHYGSG